MEKKFWWFSKKNDSDTDFTEINNGYYGEDMSADDASASNNTYYGYGDDGSDVSVVLSGDPSKKEPLTKKIFTPKTCEDSAEIVDAFKEGKACVICVEELDRPNFLRLFDYLMGAVQALDGALDRIDRDTVVLFPYGTDEDISIDDIPECEEEEIEDEDEESEDNGDID